MPYILNEENKSVAHLHHKQDYYAGKGPRKFLVLIIAVFIFALSCLLCQDHIKKKLYVEQFHLFRQQETEGNPELEEIDRQTILDRLIRREKGSFYQMLADGSDVNILLVGDSVSAGSGATAADHIWTNLLREALKSKYGVAVKITNISIGGAASYAGYVQTRLLSDNVNYNLVILCYGQNDSKKNFDLYYESLIRAVKNRYPKASIICIQESSQKEYTEKIQTIQSIADHYGLPAVDMIAPFQKDYDMLVRDGVHPNDDGQQVYCETVMNIIEHLVTEYRGYDPENVAVINETVKIFDNFLWFPAERFTREANTFTLNTQMQAVVLGIDYVYRPGVNSCKILIDGVECMTREFTYDHHFSKRHIVILNKWLANEPVNIHREIKVVFDEDESGKYQADGFIGLAFSGKNEVR